LRLTSKSRILWIDAICIDQSDIDEKGEQLALMRNIYAEAKQVLIWLGGPDEQVESAFRYLRDPPVGEDGRHEWPNDDDPAFIAEIPGFFRLFNNPWWKGMWTAQELVVATGQPLLVCGRSTLPWGVLNSMIIKFTMSVLNGSIPLDVDMEPIENVRTLRRAWETLVVHGPGDRDEVLEFDNLLIATSNRRASDPNDQIFAVVGMVPKHHITSIVQNYRQSVSSIYQRAMVDAIKSRGSLEFLRYVTIPKGLNR
jgi:hypothetical protein